MPASDSLYFDLHVEATTQGTAQNLKFIASGYLSDRLELALTTDATSIDLIEFVGRDRKLNSGHDARSQWGDPPTGSGGYGNPCPSGTGTLGVADLPGCNNVITWDDYPSPSTPTREHFLRLRRTDPDVPLGTVTVAWVTDLTVVFGRPNGAGSGYLPITFAIISEQDESPSDEMMIRVPDIDGLPWHSPLSNWYLGDFDVDEDDSDIDVSSTFEKMAGWPFRYTEKIFFRVWEEDDPDLYDTKGGVTWSIMQLEFGEDSAMRRKGEKFGPIDAGEGEYWLRANLSHGLQRWQPPDAKPPAKELQGLPGVSACQSSTYGSSSSASDCGTASTFGPQAAIDLSEYSMAHTQYQSQPWWNVDLGQDYELESVWLYNRLDCCQSRLSDYTIQYRADGAAAFTALSTHGYPAQYPTIVSTPVLARYLRIKLNKPDYLHLPRVRIWGRDP